MGVSVAVGTAGFSWAAWTIGGTITLAVTVASIAMSGLTNIVGFLPKTAVAAQGRFGPPCSDTNVKFPGRGVIAAGVAPE
jgi:hypothetical protein